ncbi:MAG: BON domain-containing protein [Pigmentiphaga sp.]|nr:BON domain-containing protein [Pigmentiphaga sp.]
MQQDRWRRGGGAPWQDDVSRGRRGGSGEGPSWQRFQEWERGEGARPWEVQSEQSHRQLTNDSGHWRGEAYPERSGAGGRRPDFDLGEPNRHGPEYEEGGTYPGVRDWGVTAEYASNEGWRPDSGYGRGLMGGQGMRRRGAWADDESASHPDNGVRYWRGGPDDGPRPQPRRIDPKGYIRSDERIREVVCERLSHSGLDVSDVEVSVQEGRVALEGTVPSRRVKHAVEDCADGCAGVVEVENRVRVANRDDSRSAPGTTI